MWDSQAQEKHWIHKLPIQETLEIDIPDIANAPTVSQEKIIFPPLHMKLGLMKQFTKALLMVNVLSI